MSDLNHIRQQAAEWVVALQEAGADERARLQAECEIWQAEDPRRRQVLEQIQQMWQAPEPALERRRKRRRQLTGLGSLLLLAWFGTQLPWAYWGADYRTAAGEIRVLPLPDGSQVVLNSYSAIDLDYTEGARTVKLVRGELLATVAKGPDAPFKVETRDISATALGTQYTVKLAGSYSRVAVQESTVAVTPHNGGDTLRLTSGQQADLNRGGLITQSTAPTHRPDWANGQLVFNNTPLPQVIERLGRHRAGMLVLDETLAASQRPPHFTGVLPADDSDAALALLSDVLNLKVKHFTPWYVTLSQK
ncbi:Anti-FecI sigma factor, FecR [Alloalcanivorax dieselolei B5]|uniref:Anti-FecI sigma factor, FecR n=1 Tax=Alcanivorax dieselolei (strain DSM 16502 / CGMCC 1.3690 / MCCC 1A00001 / B-5) TaxID=930169 RepID=K0C7U0_ALCDB|nr:FecR domain-containing protein [Alloalcanivorax dieselolei]AFT68623.1 Anti-FecI sigma factor, FecR [Alloalcanivorax dieselolei B5]GGK05801.1 fec operon regulator FecR [Alloalcanivorax dieselolei]